MIITYNSWVDNCDQVTGYLSLALHCVAKPSLVAQHGACVNERLAVIYTNDVIIYSSEFECRTTHATADIECPLWPLWLLSQQQHLYLYVLLISQPQNDIHDTIKYEKLF